MRKLFLILSAFISFALLPPIEAKAQIGQFRNDLSIGFSGGMVMNRISFDPTVGQLFKMGPTLGFTLRYTCEKYFAAVCALQVELNYAELGWKEEIISYESMPLPDTYLRKQHYFQLPFLARLAWGREHKGVMGYLVAGPQVGVCFRENEERSSTWTMRTNGYGEIIPDRPNDRIEQYDMPIERRFDYGITGGLGMEINSKVGHFLIEGRYYFGLSDIFNNSKKDVFGRSANGTIIAKVSYLFDVNNKKQHKRLYLLEKQKQLENKYNKRLQKAQRKAERKAEREAYKKSTSK